MSYRGLLEQDVTLPPIEVILLATFFGLTTGLSLVLLGIVLVNTLSLGYWSITAVAAVGICVAAGIFYVGVTQTLAAFG